MSTTPTTTRSSTARAVRLRAIVDGARVREHLRQDALHEQLPDGQHEIILGGRRFVASNVDAAIQAARGNTL